MRDADDAELDRLEAILDRALAGEPVEEELARLPQDLAARVRRLLPVYGTHPPRGGRATAPPPPGLAGSEAFGPYRIVGELGRGGQGAVYLAEDPRTQSRVALKVLTGLGAVSERGLARFRREA